LKRQFDRVASVIFGKPGLSNLIIEDLRISFDVTKTNTSESNKGKIEITNLSQESRNKIRELDEVITLSAGYREEDGAEVLFIGDITLLNHAYPRPEVVTKIEAGDGEKVTRESTLSLSYKEGFSIRQILTDISKKLAVPQKINLTTLPFVDKKFSNGYSFIGPAKNALDVLCEAVGLEWSFQNSELKIQLIGKGDLTRAIVVSEATGMIDSPERLEKIGASMNKDDKTPGWLIRTLLQPKAEPGGVVSVTSREIPNGTVFKIHEVQHVGDIDGETWETKMKVFEQK